MKKLGLVGGTGPTSTLLYYKGITSIVHKKMGRLPNINIESLSAFDILDFSNEVNHNHLAEYLLSSFKILKAAGCEIGALTGLTPHIVLSKIRELSPVKIVSIIDTTMDYVDKIKVQKVGLIGTIPTMKGKFFREAFEEHGVQVITPENDDMYTIETIIEKELGNGIINEKSQKELLKIVEKMQDKHKIDSLVLGSTELPLLFKKTHPELTVIDAMQIHANVLAEMIMS